MGRDDEENMESSLPKKSEVASKDKTSTSAKQESPTTRNNTSYGLFGGGGSGKYTPSLVVNNQFKARTGSVWKLATSSLQDIVLTLLLLGLAGFLLASCASFLIWASGLSILMKILIGSPFVILAVTLCWVWQKALKSI